MASSNASLETIGSKCVQDFFIRNVLDFLQMFYIVYEEHLEEDYDTFSKNIHNYEISVSNCKNNIVII